MRYTPIYRLPALESSSTVKEVYDQSWSIATLLEQTLLNTGQVPIGADLQSLLTRVKTLEDGGGGVVHGEYTAAQTGLANNTLYTIPTPTRVAAMSTFAASSTAPIRPILGGFEFNPGLYSIHVSFGISPGAAFDRTLAQFRDVDAPSAKFYEFGRVNMPPGEDQTSMALPNWYVPPGSKRPLLVQFLGNQTGTVCNWHFRIDQLKKA